MRKYILIVSAIMITSVVFAQKTKVQSAYSYNQAFERNRKCSELKSGIEAIDMAIEHEQTKTWAKTWKYRGDLYFNIIASKDKLCKEIDVNALDKCADSYLKALVLNFDDAELKKLNLEKEDGSDMMKFLGALQNKSKVDDDSYIADIMGRRFPGLAGEYANAGIGLFTKKDYKGAQDKFGKSMLISQLTGKMDTMILFNTALASEYAEDFETAKKTYDALIALKYNIGGNGPDLYRSMARIYKKEGNKEKAAEYIKKGREAYPDNNNLLVEELEGYLQSGDHEKALENLNIAITNDAANPVLYFARGTVYENEKINNKDKAVADYIKALELDPNYFDAAFNLGAHYFNTGADNINESNDVPINETKKFNALKAEAKKNFEAAVPYIETAHKVKPSDVDTGNMLIKLYTHTEQYEKAKEIRAKFE